MSEDVQARPRRAARFWKPLEVAALCVTAVAWFGSTALWMHYDATRPTRPDDSTGRVYAQNTHGSIVYLNKAEEATVTVLMWTAGMSAVIAIGIDASVNPFRRRRAE